MAQQSTRACVWAASKERAELFALQVGHLLGLGDRHLDNILLHKQAGHVVHLDFNVIFGRQAHVLVV